ncbi:hypothetical protein SDC9_142591 [bioreactor metagenome]|uniref:Uncharacterized protein n=1 Tax=bioreactor metagenome TaxID=1076179 RepID=A0A645E192_9ZZZZ
MRAHNQISDAAFAQMRADLRENLAVTRAKRLELRFDLIAQETGSIDDELRLLDVELLGDDLHIVLVHGFALNIHQSQRLAGLDIAVVTRGAAKGDDVEHARHVRFQIRIDACFLRDGIVAEMNALGSARIHAAHEVLIDLLGHKRQERRGEQGQRIQRGIERHVRGLFVFRHFAAPIAFAAAADVPVAQLVRKRLQRAPALGDAQLVEVAVHGFDQRVEPREHPAIHLGELAVRKLILVGLNWSISA